MYNHELIEETILQGFYDLLFYIELDIDWGRYNVDTEDSQEI